MPAESNQKMQMTAGHGKTLAMMRCAHKLAQQTIDPAELAQRMRDKRDANGLTIQEAAAEAGVSAAIFSRVARGHLPDVEHLLLP